MSYISQQMRAMDRMFERMMETFEATTPLKAIDKAFPKKGDRIKMYKPVLQEYEYKECPSCGATHMVEVQEEPKSDE